MVAEMTGAYWFWRVSEGGLVEPFRSAGSAMPAWKTELSVDDRWAVIAYQHSLSAMPALTTPPSTRSFAARKDGRTPSREACLWRMGNTGSSKPAPWSVALRHAKGVAAAAPRVQRHRLRHAHLGETLLRTQDAAQVEKARLEVLDFIFSSPKVPPDEEQIAPTFSRLAPEVAKTFDWAHVFHRSLYDLFASDVPDKETIYRKLLTDYLEKPEAITPHRLDHHQALWSFAESKSFRDRFPKFNTQIWPITGCRRLFTTCSSSATQPRSAI